MSRRRRNREVRLLAAVGALGVLLALTAGLRAASAATNDNKQEKGSHSSSGPRANDFIDIKQVKPNNQGINANSVSSGSFIAECGVNANHHNNPDNNIVAPKTSNGAHHEHDYVGNLTTNGFSNDKSLAKGGTTCKNKEDQSAYFWPVLRDLTQTGKDVKKNGGGLDKNIGEILTPVSVTIVFLGSPDEKVVPMPQDLKIIEGDAKAITNGPKNANARWTCSGFENRTTTKYPLCPEGSLVERINDFPSCWDGKNIDSADHRSHIVFPNRNGNCSNGFKPVAHLRYILKYDAPQGRNFAIDSFPEEGHNPSTDHADFELVMSGDLRARIADCVNSGRKCVNE
jgi:Domain of unknown function (DUF1996)